MVEQPSVPFHLTGAYAPVDEEQTLLELEVVGEIPPDLCGTYVRNGPNPRGTSPAWFAGAGMLHAVRLERGAARWYRNRWMRGAHGPNTSVARHAGHLLALVEAAMPIEVDAELKTIGPFDFDGKLPRPMIAHPKVCPATGQLLFISYGRDRPHLTYYRADAAGRMVHRAPIEVPEATYMHDMGITEQHVLFWDLPVLLGDWRSPMPLLWSDKHSARIGVLRRDGYDGDVQWFSVKPCVISHAMNAFEDGSLVVFDVIRAERLASPFALYRYTFDLLTGRVTEATVDGRFVDFPRVHPAVEGRPYRCGYALDLLDWETGSWQRTIARKYDITTGASKTHDFGPSRVVGELAIAARQGATAEDEVWLLGFVYDRARGASDLVVLDGQRFEDEPVATVRLPCRVPIGLHGVWLPG